MVSRKLFKAILIAIACMCVCEKQPGNLNINNPLDREGANWHPPVIAKVNDTVALQTDTVAITINAKDTTPGGSVQKYYWDIGATGKWNDSTTLPVHSFANATGGSVTIICEAKSENGSIAKDTFVIGFIPSLPVQSFPANGETGLALTDTLTWSTVNGATSYEVQVSTSSTFATILIEDSTLTTAIKIISGLTSNTTYYWRVQAKNAGGVSGYTSAYSFATIGMKLINGGTFSMGEVGIAETVHSVTLSSFNMDTTDVTQADYLAVMGVTPSSFSGDTKRPVENVTWFDAVLYCNARSKTMGLDTVYSYTSVTGTAGNGCSGLGNIAIDYTKKGYRLPTEAEFEYACRGGTTTTYWWGADTNGMGARAWTSYNSNGSTQPVATKLANAYGLYDMAGNVWQWCNDWYGSYDAGSVTNPKGAATGTSRVLRGGSGEDGNNVNFRSANRSYAVPDGRGSYIGFRVVLSR